MAYYNSKLALWEPVLEPVERQAANGRTQHTRFGRKTINFLDLVLQVVAGGTLPRKFPE